MKKPDPFSPPLEPTGADALFRPLYLNAIKPRMECPVLILRAPRACGKTELVEIMREQLAIPPEHVVDGKAHDAGRALIDLQVSVRALVDVEMSHLVIDDVDELIIANPIGSEYGQALRTAFETLISDANASSARVRLILTITLRPERINEPSMLISDVLRTVPIEPTAFSEAVWREALLDAVSATVHGGQRRTAADTDLAETLFELSGGHPSLMVAGLDAISALFGQTADPEIGRRRGDGDFVRKVVTTAMHYDGGRPIRRQVLRMRAATDKAEATVLASALEALRIRLDESPSELFTLPVPEGEALLAAGFVRNVDPRLPGTFALWGGEFLEVMREALAAPTHPPTKDSVAEHTTATNLPKEGERRIVVPRPIPGSRRGELCFTSPDGERPMANLTPQSWLIASSILKANGAVLSVKQIHDMLFLEAPGDTLDGAGTGVNLSGTMTAIQRMLKEIARTSEKPIVNVRGEGYRLDLEHYELHDTVEES